MKRISDMAKWNPQPGDVVRVGNETRRVVGIGHERITYWCESMQRTVTCWRWAWAKWARDAEVLHVAD